MHTQASSLEMKIRFLNTYTLTGPDSRAVGLTCAELAWPEYIGLIPIWYRGTDPDLVLKIMI